MLCTKPIGLHMRNREAVLLSGGLDSTALCFLMRPKLAITIDYGQKAFVAEARSSKAVCRRLHIKHEIIKVDCSKIGFGSMHRGPSLKIPTNRLGSLTPEWWPYRNQLLITAGAAKCILSNITTLYVGTVSSDRSHKDGTKRFISLMASLLSMQEGNLRLKAPFLRMSTQRAILKHKVPLALLGWTHSCHTSSLACGRCRGCLKRMKVLNSCFPNAFTI